MPITTPPPAPNPLGTNFAAEALAFTQWMQAAAPEFNTAVNDANAAVGGAEQAVLDAAAQVGLATTQAGNASSSATLASGHATAADTARANAVIAKDAAENARDMSQTYAALAGASAGLPALAGQALKNLRVKSDETGVEWTAEAAPGSMARNAKTSAYTLAGADKGALIDCTGTWTLGFDAAATLGAGWWCYVRNVGTGTITADPNSTETIDGVTSGVIRPGMTLLVQCDGTAFHCVRVGPAVSSELLTSGTSWTCPLGVRRLRVRGVGGGGGGKAYGSDNTTGGSGGGGGYFEGFAAVTPGTVYSYSIGAGGAANTSDGGNTTFTASNGTFTANGGSLGGGFVGGAGGTASGPDAAVGIPGGQGIGSFSGSTPNGSRGIGGGTPMSSYGVGGGGGGTSANSGTKGAIILEY